MPAISAYSDPLPELLELLTMFPYGYSGQLRDRAGLLPYGFRSYDPAAGRWTSPDPAQLQGSERAPLNFYQMVDANPVTFRDDRGLMKLRDLTRFLQLMTHPLGIPESILNTEVPRLVFSYADAKSNPLTPKWKLGSAKEWIHPINWIGGPRSFGSFHRVELDELIRRDSSLPEIPEDIRDLIVQFKALELFAVGLTKLHLRRQDVKKVFRDSNEFVWDGLRTHELGQGNAALMLGAILVWGKQLHGYLKWQEKPYRGYGCAYLDYAAQREYALLHTLYVAMWTLGDDDSRYALHDSAVSRNVEVLDDETTRTIPLGKGRLVPFTSPQTVWQDMKAAFRPRKPFLRSILARIIYELGASSYRGAMDLSRSIVDDEQRLINHIANDKRRNTMVRYDIERVYRSFARKGRGLSRVQIQKIRKRQKQLRKQEQDRRIGKRIDRTRIWSAPRKVVHYLS